MTTYSELLVTSPITADFSLALVASRRLADRLKKLEKDAKREIQEGYLTPSQMTHRNLMLKAIQGELEKQTEHTRYLKREWKSTLRERKRQRMTLFKPTTARDWIKKNVGGILGEIWKRFSRDGLRMYRALPTALDFHHSTKLIRVLTGSNQSGKTTAAVSEVSRIVRGQHPLYPARDGTLLCVGNNADHLGLMWQELTGEGSFECIRDEVTGIPRAVTYDPDNPRVLLQRDLDRKSEWFRSPPLLPEHEWNWETREIKGVAWEDKGGGVPRIVRIKSTGWTMLWHPGGGPPRRGLKINGFWFDEEVPSDWFLETMPRLMRRGGRGIWSATPQTCNRELMKLIQMSQDDDPNVGAWSLYLQDTPYISEEQKMLNYRMWAEMSEEDLQVRFFGRPTLLGRLVYPQFDLALLSANGFEDN